MNGVVKYRVVRNRMDLPENWIHDTPESAYYDIESRINEAVDQYCETVPEEEWDFDGLTDEEYVQSCFWESLESVVEFFGQNESTKKFYGYGLSVASETDTLEGSEHGFPYNYSIVEVGAWISFSQFWDEYCGNADIGWLLGYVADWHDFEYPDHSQWDEINAIEVIRGMTYYELILFLRWLKHDMSYLLSPILFGDKKISVEEAVLNNLRWDLIEDKILHLFEVDEWRITDYN